MVIPAIELNAGVRSVGVKYGVYDVPWYDVGWQNNSAPLGAPGNTVFNGHLDTIDAGRVFYRLHQLQPGDAVYLYTDGYRTDWVVEWAGSVPNADWWFVEPTDDLRLTLYTCEGAWNWLAQQYSDYRVVVARFYDYAERAAQDEPSDS
jgi:sortase (surface protein transpeptidase)